MVDKNSTKGRAFLVPVILMVFMGAVLFLPAGTLKYWEAWGFLAAFLTFIVFISVYFSKKNPEFLARRTRFKQDETPRKPPALLNLCFLCFLIPGFDHRFHWSVVPLWLVIIGNIIVILGYVLIIYIFRENSFASPSVEIQQEQRVITTGPYAVVRHPMYLGIVLIMLFAPLALGSFWAILPALLCIPLNVLRIRGEETVLKDGLPGYDEYIAKTRYRLIPLVW